MCQACLLFIHTELPFKVSMEINLTSHVKKVSQKVAFAHVHNITKQGISSRSTSNITTLNSFNDLYNYCSIMSNLSCYFTGCHSIKKKKTC